MQSNIRLQGRELETIINVNASDSIAYVHTRIAKHHRHFERLGVKPTKVHKDSEGTEFGWDYEIPSAWVRLPKGKAKRVMTEEQRKAASDRFRNNVLAKRTN